jgi:hypothetical protein
VHTEVIPKSLARSVADISFDPAPTSIVNPDPVVQYAETIPAGGDFTARYEIDVDADGADRARLEAWADDVAGTSTRESTTTTSSTTSSTTTTTTPSGGGSRSSSSGSGGSGSSGGSGGTPTGGAVLVPPAGGAPPPPPPPPPADEPKSDPKSPPTTHAPAPPQAGTIVIRVVSRGGTGTFGYSGPGGNVSVATSGSPNGVGQSSPMQVSPGTYTWKQVKAPAGYGVLNVDCTDRDAGPFDQRSTVSGSSATFNVQPGETVTCTWTNR